MSRPARAGRIGAHLVTVVVMVALATTGPGAGAPVAHAAGQASPVARVRLPFPQDDGSLTPYTFELGYSLVSLVYDTLLLRDANGVPRPWLARSIDTSADGMTLTIRLDQGARWHDGEPVTSADVAFTFDYVRRRPHPRFTPELDAVGSVATPDRETVVVTLRHTSAGFMDQPLADLPVLPAHLWRDLPPGSPAPEGLAVGSGPYRLVEHEPGQGYRFEADPGYFRGPPAVSSIEVLVMKALDEVVEAFREHRLDMLPSGLPGDVSTKLKHLDTVVQQGTSYLGTVLMLNVRRPPFDRPEVRRAVASAIDLGRVVSGVGEGVAAEHGYVHPASPWAPTARLHRFDPAAARSQLATVPALELLIPDNDPVRAEAGRQVASALQRAGVSATLGVLPRQELSKAVGEDGSAPSFQAAIWSAPPLASYDPDFLRRLFGSDPKDAPLNHSGYASAQFDALSERISTTVDPAARRSAVGAALRLLSEDLPVVPLFFSDGAYAFRPGVFDGWVPVKGGDILDKRSFVQEVTPRATRPPTTAVPSESGGWWSPGRAALILVGAAGALAVWGLVRRP